MIMKTFFSLNSVCYNYCGMYMLLCGHFGLMEHYINGHYSRFTACIFQNDIILVCYMPQLYFVCKHLIAVCTYHHVITLGLWNKYDTDGHYSRFTARILVNPCEILHHIAMHTIVVFCMQ